MSELLDHKYQMLIDALVNYEEAIHNRIKEGEAELASYEKPLRARVLNAIKYLALIRDLADDISESDKVGA